jgi:hypothetical protein
MRFDPGADDTIRLVPRRPPPQPRRPWQWVAAGAAAAVVAMGVAGWLGWPRQAPVPLPISTPVQTRPPAPSQQGPAQPGPSQQAPAQPGPTGQIPAQAIPAEPAPTQPAPQAALPFPVAPALVPFPIQTADEAEIRAHVSTGLTVFRFAANPSIIVLDFASLHEQGLMLNRIAALTEKGAMPRDRVLNDTELDAAISAGGDTVETFYYGHDYSAASIARFFWLAAQDKIRLSLEEEELRQLLAQLGWLVPDARGGLISVPKVGADAQVNAAARNAILRHELSHGEYFSNPAYAAYVHRFWVHDLTRDEQDGVRKFLASEEYDPKLEDLIENEMQAYLMFTRDPVFFTPSKVGMTPARLTELQVAFHRSMPRGWLRDLLGQTLPMAAAPY